MKPEPPDPLDALLNRWTPDAPLPPHSLAPDVWRRIAAEESAPPRGWARVHRIFERTSFAAAFVATCVLLGLFLAEVRRSRLQANHEAALVRNYLRLVDPLAAATTATEGTPR